MKWRGTFYVDMVLPFGVRSAPYIFTRIADLVEWVAKQNYDVTFLMHYLDDFHTLGPPSSSVCQHNLDRSIDCFSKLGIPLHPDKLEGPLTCLTILAIELDSLNLQAHFPQDKFDRMTALLEDWSQKRWCKRKELESLIGHLQHACKVVPQGRSFLRRMINLLCAFHRDDHLIRLNQEFFLDPAWWKEFFQSWNGCSFFQYPQWAPLPDFEVSSDASGALGYGAVFQGHWFSGAWLPTQVSQSIEYKELFPIVVAAYLWGPQWTSQRVNFLSDNRSVVDILRSGTSRAPTIMSLVRYLSLLVARHSFSFTASPVRGKSNPIADSLSLSVSALSPASPSCRLPSDPDSVAAPLGLGSWLSDKCHFYLTQGLAPSTRKVYASAQRRFLAFCVQDNSLSPSGSPLPASEDMLIRFCVSSCRYSPSFIHKGLPFSDPVSSR